MYQLRNRQETSNKPSACGHRHYGRALVVDFPSRRQTLCLHGCGLSARVPSLRRRPVEPGQADPRYGAQSIRLRHPSDCGFNIDIETCCECGGAVKIIACIEDPAVIQKILVHLQEKAALAGLDLLPQCRAPP